ncbi:MAG: AMP-binding protein [Gemmatimonadota bacterium]
MIFRSPHPDIVIPEEPFHTYVLGRVVELADKLAFVDADTGRRLTYAGLADGAERVAAGLAQRGLEKGDVVAICSSNRPEYPLAFHGVATLGGIVTTLNPLSTPKEIAHQLDDSGARYFITEASLLPRVRVAAAHTGVREIFFFRDEGEGGRAAAGPERPARAGAPRAAMRAQDAASATPMPEAAPATPFSALLESTDAVPEVHIDPREDVVALPYSSGTTGKPKGVMLTHYNLVANVAQILAVDRVPEDEVAIAVLPFFHIYGMIVVMSMIPRAGGTVVTMRRFRIEQFLRTVETYRVTRAHLVPPIVLALAQHPRVDEFDLSSLRFIGSGAAPLGEGTARACAERVGCPVAQGYGLTETSPVTHWSSPERPGAGKLASVGPSVPNTEVRIGDLETGRPLGPGQRGEVWLRGPQVMKGYLNRPEDTARTVDGEGWLHSGDVGYVDEEGYLYLVDRAKELIKYKGYQVPPAELEELLLSHPAVADAAVIPSPDEEAGEVPKAFVVLREADSAEGRVSAEDLLGFVAGRVAPYKRVRRLEFADAIPKSASGKILRRVLVERERAGSRPCP